MSGDAPPQPSARSNPNASQEADAVLDLLLDAALREDLGPGDWTTLWTVGPDAGGSGVVVAKEAMVVAGTRIASRVFTRVDPRLRVTLVAVDGDQVESSNVVLAVEGPLRGILTGERTALNFLGRLSGIATLTRKFVSAVQGTGVLILDTRKTTPGWRVLEKEAVLAGGGRNHRQGLYDMVLVKDNHIEASGGIREALSRVADQNKQGVTVEVEVSTLEGLEEALALPVDRILLDNMTLDTMAEAVSRVKARGEGRPRLEASGNVTLANVRSVAKTGVDFISVGALTHSAPSADLSLRIVHR